VAPPGQGDAPRARAVLQRQGRPGLSWTRSGSSRSSWPSAART
jgi:hypothetical protein